MARQASLRDAFVAHVEAVASSAVKLRGSGSPPLLLATDAARTLEGLAHAGRAALGAADAAAGTSSEGGTPASGQLEASPESSAVGRPSLLQPQAQPPVSSQPSITPRPNYWPPSSSTAAAASEGGGSGDLFRACPLRPNNSIAVASAVAATTTTTKPGIIGAPTGLSTVPSPFSASSSSSGKEAVASPSPDYESASALAAAGAAMDVQRLSRKLADTQAALLATQSDAARYESEVMALRWAAIVRGGSGGGGGVVGGGTDVGASPSASPAAFLSSSSSSSLSSSGYHAAPRPSHAPFMGSVRPAASSDAFVNGGSAVSGSAQSWASPAHSHAHHHHQQFSTAPSLSSAFGSAGSNGGISSVGAGGRSVIIPSSSALGPVSTQTGLLFPRSPRQVMDILAAERAQRVRKGDVDGGDSTLLSAVSDYANASAASVAPPPIAPLTITYGTARRVASVPSMTTTMTIASAVTAGEPSQPPPPLPPLPSQSPTNYGSSVVSGSSSGSGGGGSAGYLLVEPPRRRPPTPGASTPLSQAVQSSSISSATAKTSGELRDNALRAAIAEAMQQQGM